MTGLEKILDRIKSESDASVELILSGAEEKCREIKSRAVEDAEKAVEDIRIRAEAAGSQIMKRAKSSAEHETAQNLLRRKREVIDEVISGAEKKLLSVGDVEYFGFMSKLLKANTDGSGEVIFNAKDKARLPADFDLMGHKLSDRTGDFSGGFILDYGDIEINCTVSALFEGAYERLSDTVNGILFREV